MRAARQQSVLLIGAPLREPDLEYATGFRAADPVVFLQEDRTRWLVVSELEFGRAQREARGINVLTPRLLNVGRAGRASPAAWALKLLRRRGVQAVTVPGTFPLGAAERLRRGGVKLRVGADPLFPRRAVKRADELGRIRQAQQAAVIAMREAIERIRRAEPGRDGVLELEGATLTSERLRRGIHQRLLDLDCQARDTIVAGGPASADPHETGSGPLRAGEPVVLDIFPQHLDHGYWGDLTRTVVRGRAAPRLRRMYAAVKAAQAAALAAVRPGVCCATVHRAASRELDRRGFGSHIEDGRAVGFIHSTGHGVGLAIHEPPAVSLNRTRLRSGHVITVEPGLYYPDIGGIRIEDTIVVQPGGWQYLVPCEKRFEL